MYCNRYGVIDMGPEFTVAEGRILRIIDKVVMDYFGSGGDYAILCDRATTKAIGESILSLARESQIRFSFR